MTSTRIALAAVFLWFASLLAGLSSCTSAKPALIVSGTTLHVAAETFVETASLMDKCLDSGVVSPEQYRTWAEFGKRYQVAYPLAVEAWRIAVRTEAEAEQRAASETIAALVGELARFYVEASLAITRSIAVDGGAP